MVPIIFIVGVSYASTEPYEASTPQVDKEICIMYILLEKRILIFKKLYTMLFFKKCFYKKEYESLFTLPRHGKQTHNNE